MNTKQQYIEYHHKAAFEASENLDTIAAAGLTFASVVLFHLTLSGEAATKPVIQTIRGLFINTNNPYDAYMEFCERLLLALDNYTCHFSGTAFGHNALDWLRCKNNGYACTESLYHQLLQKRKLNAMYKMNWRSLAEAVLDCIEDGSPERFEYWIHWFRVRHARFEMFIFLKAIEFQTTKMTSHAR